MSPINIFVTGAPLASQAALSALRFCLECEREGTHVAQVFFYSDATHVANSLMVPMTDELDLAQAWSNFAARTGTLLLACISSSERRGIVGAESVRDHELQSDNVARGFQIAGLGVFNAALLSGGALVSFS